MSHSNIEIKTGTSKKVEIHSDFVIKRPKNEHIDDEELSESLILGIHGEFENIKEIFFWKTVKKYPFLKTAFAEIFQYELNDMSIKAEKLSPVDEEYFYNRFYTIYGKFYLSRYFIGQYLDNHTIENYENYGIDAKGNLKLLDYSIKSEYIADLYKLDFMSIKTADQLISIDIEMFNDINSGKLRFSEDILQKITAFVITLKYHNNMPLFYYYSYKYKLLSFKEIWKAIWSK
jgi:hypothetical protein